jgi:3-methyladenine DNA glycosylase AlkD
MESVKRVMNLDKAIEEINRLKRPGTEEVYISDINTLVKSIKKDHELAEALWETGDRTARHVAVRIADPLKTDEKLLEHWLGGLVSWGLTDGFATHLVRHTPFAVYKAREWAERNPEFERRAGFSVIAQLAWSKNDTPDHVFIDFLPLIEKTSGDNRFYVKKAVNWALRDIGKRNVNLCGHACKTALKLQASSDKTARWVGRHRIKEFMPCPNIEK